MATFVFVRLSDINNAGTIGVRCRESVDGYFSNHGSLLRGLSVQYTPMGIRSKPRSHVGSAGIPQPTLNGAEHGQHANSLSSDKPPKASIMEGMEAMEPIDAATSVLDTRFPTCRAAFLSASVLSARRTPTSDLDIVVVLDGPPAPYRETIRDHGWVIELFVHTRESLRYFYDRELQQRRCTLATMCAEGTVLRSIDHECSDIQTEARAIIDAGPAALSCEELDQRRYALTDTLDDLRGTSDRVEAAFITGHLLAGASELVLLSQRRWTGQSKWLARHLAEAPGNFGELLSHGVRALLSTGDKQPMINAVNSALELAGGPLTEGYRASRPADIERNSPG
jgi:hypothetical protein